MSQILTSLPQVCVEDLVSNLKNSANDTRCRFGAVPLSSYYKCRKVAEKSIMEYIEHEEQIRGEDLGDKRKHRIGVMSALSGFGKTRLLFELPHIFEDRTHWKFIYMTYNSNFPQYPSELRFPSASMFPWRLLYFYFSPTFSWEDFLIQIVPLLSTSHLTLPGALQIICDDIKQLSPALVGRRVVLILTIDEFQLLCDKDRLTEVVTILSAVMCTQSEHYLCVPLFTGLRSTPFKTAAEYSSMWPFSIALPPLTYDDAEEIILSASRDPTLMQNPIVPQLVWQFSSVPACLLTLLEYYQKNKDWMLSYRSVLETRFACSMSELIVDPTRETHLLRLIAFAITKTSVVVDPSLIFLDTSGLCWFEADRSIGAPYAILELITVRWSANPTRITSPENFGEAFRETAAAVVEELGSPDSVSWSRLESLCCAYTAFRMNCFGLLDLKTITLPILLGGAYFPPTSPIVNMHITPTYLSRMQTDIQPSNLSLSAERSHYARTWPDQVAIDAFAFFPNSNSGRDPPVVFDLFVFQQMKYRSTGGLVAAVYKAAAVWCREFVVRYTESTGRQAGFVFGVIDPLKTISAQLKTHLSTLVNVVQREFYFAIGREESTKHFGMLANHPVFIPHVYVNDPYLQANHLALHLPSSWTYPEERANRINDERPTEGYGSWEQIVARAILPDEDFQSTPMPLGIKLNSFVSANGESKASSQV
jgi:hypothetical protein